MIRLEVEGYCHSCLDFNPDVTRAERVYGDKDECSLTDTVVRCVYRKRCAGLMRYLENQTKGEPVG
jgi:hypothetical protein